MASDEVVPRKVQAIRSPEVSPFFRERICEPSQAAHSHGDREILALDVGRAHFRGIPRSRIATLRPPPFATLLR